MQEIIKKISTKELSEFVNEILDNVNSKTKKSIVTANPEIIVISEKDPNIDTFLRDDNTLITADGIGVVKAYKKITGENIDRVTGVDITKEILFNTNKPLKLFIYGSKEDNLNQFIRKINVEADNIEIVGAYNGYDYSFEDILMKIQDVDFDIALFALGVPNQERLISEVIKKIESGILIGCGGTIDVLSGSVKRAPNWAIKYNVEWLYRIVTQPKRLKRFVKYHMKFGWQLIWMKGSK